MTAQKSPAFPETGQRSPSGISMGEPVWGPLRPVPEGTVSAAEAVGICGCLEAEVGKGFPFSKGEESALNTCTVQ